VNVSLRAQAPPDPNYAPPPGYQPQPSYPPSYLTPAPSPSYPYQAPPSYPNQAPQQQAQAPVLTPQDLSNLVAPIALYPDMLLSQVLAASTYPLELVQAEQWMQANPALRGPALVDAAKQQNWDPSVQALVAFPDVLSRLASNIQWTTALGNAFLAQQADVMDAIQQLRAEARANGRLADTEQERVVVDQQNGQSAIEIQPANPQVVYAPVYNPAYVWGPPVYGAYPGIAYPPIGYGIYYAVGTFLGALFSGLLAFGGWGWGLSWFAHGLFLNTLFFSHFGFHGWGGAGYFAGRGYGAHVAWMHDPAHRLGVAGLKAAAALAADSQDAAVSRGMNAIATETARSNPAAPDMARGLRARTGKRKHIAASRRESREAPALTAPASTATAPVIAPPQITAGTPRAKIPRGAMGPKVTAGKPHAEATNRVRVPSALLNRADRADTFRPVTQRPNRPVTSAAVGTRAGTATWVGTATPVVIPGVGAIRTVTTNRTDSALKSR
jgi:Protein of unknown function (DUF3300)